MIAILEDDDRRQAEMKRLLAVSFPEHQVALFDNAPDMIEWLMLHLHEVDVICLDHDLGPSRIRNDARFEPGTGRDAANYLARQTPCCPIVIHTTNYRAVPGMMQVLDDSGWRMERVVPFSDLEWLEATWLPVLIARLGESRFRR